MAAYQKWNIALTQHFTQGVPQGRPVYLGITEGVLEELGIGLGLERDTARTDFIAAVRTAVAVEGGRVHLEHLQGCYRDGTPQGVAFLALCVLAAYDMGKDSELDTKNYFVGLRELLGVNAEEEGRPKGMRFGADAEEPLWLAWNVWLQGQGFAVTAHKEGNRYISYPISQALVRHADHLKLLRLFDEARGSVSLSWDSQDLGSFLERKIVSLTKHLTHTLRDPERRNDLLEAAYVSFERWQMGDTTGPGAHKLFAGIYRETDAEGGVSLYLYPKQRPGLAPKGLCFLHAGQEYVLRQERPGWYRPHLELTSQNLSSGLTLALRGASAVHALVLPARKLWVLLVDELAHSSALASWGPPALGLSFGLLLHTDLKRDLERCREEGLLGWESAGELEGGWLELLGCRVLMGAHRWDGVPMDRMLRDALKPRERLGLHFSGGLPLEGGWLEEALPSFSVVGDNHTEREGEYWVRSSNETVLTSGRLVQGLPQPLPSLEAGHYTLEVRLGTGETKRRGVLVRAWDSLTPLPWLALPPLSGGSPYSNLLERVLAERILTGSEA